MVFLQKLDLERVGFAPNFDGWRAWGTGNCYIDISHLEQTYNCIVQVTGENSYRVEFEEENIALQLTPAFQNREYSQKINVEWSGGKFAIACVESDNMVTVMSKARAFTFRLVDPLDVDSAENANADLIRAPMPGLAKSVKVSAGEQVVEGQVLVILEAMKMEHSLAASRDGEIGCVHINEGDQVDDAALLISLTEIHPE